MQISIGELNNKNKFNTINIIDLRDELSYSKGHIVNAKNIPVGILMREPERYLKQNET